MYLIIIRNEAAAAAVAPCCISSVCQNEMDITSQTSIQVYVLCIVESRRRSRSIHHSYSFHLDQIYTPPIFIFFRENYILLFVDDWSAHELKTFIFKTNNHPHVVMLCIYIAASRCILTELALCFHFLNNNNSSNRRYILLFIRLKVNTHGINK